MKPIFRVVAIGALAVSLCAVAPGPSALATTDPVSGAGLLPAPTGLSPNDTTVRKTVTLNWNAVAGATSYKVEVGRDATWSDEPVFTSPAKVTQLTLPTSLPHASYVWRVAAVKGTVVGRWSSETSDTEFTRGWLVAPTTIGPSGAQGVRPEFSWTPVPFASAYEVQVTDQPFIQPSPLQELPPGNVDTCFTVRTRVTFFTKHVSGTGESDPGPCFSTLLGDGSARYWRVRALDAWTKDGEYSTAPAAYGISDAAPSGEPDEEIGSDCKGDTGGGCEPAVASEYSSWSPAVAFTATATAPVGTYDVSNVVAVNALDSDPDNLCTLNSPTTGVTTCRDFPTISWSAAPGAVRYRVTVGLDAAMSNVQRLIDTRALRWTPTDSWPDAGPKNAYYVTVQACDANSCGVASTPAGFRKASPRTVITSAAPGVNGEFTLAWKSYATVLEEATGQDETQDAYAYHVEVAKADHPTFDSVVDHQVIDQTSYMPQISYGDGSFLWRVQAIDSAGHGLPWSAVQSFTRDATAPKAVSVSPSTGVGVLQSVKVTFSEPVTGVSSSSLKLSPATPTTVSVTSPTTAVIKPTSPLAPGAAYSVVLTSAIKDLSGNIALASGPSLKVNPIADNQNAAIAYGGTWRLLSSTNAIGGKYHGSTPTSASKTTATMKFGGVGVSLYSCMGPNNGYLDLYVDGVKKARVNLYRSFSGCGVKVATLTGLARKIHTFKAIGIGAHSSSSRGNGVAIDALVVSP